MPSTTRRKSANRRLTFSPSTNTRVDPTLFWPLLLLMLVVWIVYRRLFDFPVWFDETLGKAVFFGLPVWLYATVSGSRAIVASFDAVKFKSGLLQGLAFGGVYGFVATIASFLARGTQVQAAPLFSSNTFWWEFMLAVFTAFWETMFFFSLVMTVMMSTQRRWSLLRQILVTAGIFLLFHLPNTLRYFSGAAVIGQLGIVFLFAVGQAFLFARNRNAYALIVSHAIWGMVLLLHVQL